MKGIYGIGLLALGIFVAVMGGFILNAETVTTCSTDWDYVTDVGAAFQGDDSDMDVSYNPPENITGWSYLDAFNNGRLSGVDYSSTTSTNAYRAVTGDPSIVPYSMTLTATDVSGATFSPGYTGTVTGYGTYTGTMPVDFGLYNIETATSFTNGGSTVLGVFGISLSDLPSIVPDYSGLYSLGISVPQSGATPCIMAAEFSTSVGQLTNGATYNNVIYSNILATSSSDTAVVYCKEAVASIGGTKVPLDSAYLVWGQAQFDGAGSYEASVSVTLNAVLDDAPWAYLDATKGIVPVYGTYETTTMDFVSHATSTTPSMVVTLDGSDLDTSSATGTISADGVQIAEWNAFLGANDPWSISITPTGGTAVTADSDGRVGSFTVSASNGVFTFDVEGSTATYQAASTAFSEMSATIEVQGGTLPYTVEIYNDSGTATRFEGTESSTSPMVGDLSYIVYEPSTTQVQYSTVYWYNGESEQNAEVVMAFTADSYPASNTVFFRGPDGDSPVRIVCDANKVWTVGSVEIGKWTGIQVTVGYGQMTIVPISHFRTFLDYVTVEAESTVYGGTAVGGGTITSIAVSEPTSGSSLRMCVVSTVIHIPQGGLYLQNGVLDMGSAFPTSQAISVMLGSAAKMGTGITFTSGNDSVTVPVDADRRMLLLGDRWYDFNGVTFRWYSENGDSASIDGQTFAPAIYHNGSTYESGKIWAEVSGGKMVEVLDASTTWTMTLDGVWAPSVFLYEGQNVASSSVEIADFMHGEYRWDSNTFIIVLMAVSIVGGIIGSYFKVVDAWDWIAIIGTVGVLWLVL